MASIPNLEQELEKLQQASDLLGKLSENSIPVSIKSALSAVEDIALETLPAILDEILIYPLSEQAADRQRVIPAWAVSQIFSDIEEDYFRELTDGDEVFKTIVQGVFSIAFLIGHIVNGIMILIQHYTFNPFRYLKFIYEIVSAFAAIVGAPAVVRLCEGAFRFDRSVCISLRRAALPQRIGPRFRRRKRTRR
jgi:hypothetical protein